MLRFTKMLFVAVLISIFYRSASAELSLAPTTASPMQSLPSSGQGTYNASAFNPAMGLVLDAVASNTTAKSGSFDFRSAELNLMAAVDPFANLYAVINGTPDGVDVEEAAFMTTSLPYNMTIRGGRFFANFGRFSHWHDHELPFVNRLKSLDSFIGGESRSEGVELMHLFKTPFFLQGTLGVYNKIGSENTRLQETSITGSTGHTSGRGWKAMTYLGRLFTYIPLSDDLGVDLGASEALTPRQYYIGGVRQDNLHSARSLTGIDMTFRYEPLSSNVARKIFWGTEVFRNDEVRRQELAIDSNGDGTGDTDSYNRKRAFGGYSYVDWRFAPRWSTGGFVDLAENIDARANVTSTYGVSFNFHPSEFQRIRLQLSKARTNDGAPSDDQVFLQWFGTIGTHVHVFKDR